MDLHHDMLKPHNARTMLKDAGIDPRVGRVIIKMIEDGIQTRMMVAETIRQLDAAINVVNNVQNVMGVLKDRLSKAGDAVKQLRLPDGVSSEEPSI